MGGRTFRRGQILAGDDPDVSMLLRLERGDVERGLVRVRRVCTDGRVKGLREAGRLAEGRSRAPESR
jgi:hypothetical protein